MKYFYGVILYGVMIFGIQACKGMTAQELVQQRMNIQMSVCYDVEATSALLDQLSEVMKQNNGAAMAYAQTKAHEYEESCSEKESIKAVLRAGYDGAHARLQEFKEVIECLPEEMPIFLRDIFGKLRALLLNSEHVDSVGQMLKNLESYDLLTQQVIRQVKIDLKQAYTMHIDVKTLIS